MLAFKGTKSHSIWTSFVHSKPKEKSKGQKCHFVPAHSRFCAQDYLGFLEI